MSDQNDIWKMEGKKTAELWMCVHWCVKSYLIKAEKRLQQWTVPVHLIKSTCTRERWEMESKANRGAVARSLRFSLDANQRLDLRAGQASGTSLCLADPGNLLLIIPSLTLHPLRTRQPISPNLYGHWNEQTQPPKVHIGLTREWSHNGHRVITCSLLSVFLCGSNLEIL